MNSQQTTARQFANKHLTIQLGCELTHVVTVERTAEEICASMGISPEKSFMIVLAISEALTNIMVHGLGHSAQEANPNNPASAAPLSFHDEAVILSAMQADDNQILVSFSYDDTELTVILQDAGNPYPDSIVERLESGTPQPFRIPPDPVDVQNRGRGIDLILMASCTASYQRQGEYNTLKLVFDNG